MRPVQRYPALGMFSFLLLCGTWSCTIRQEKKQVPVTDSTDKPHAIKKPPATFPDTLTIHTPAAVFYQPDSIQLEKLRLLMQKGPFESMQHEFEYQVKNARKVLKTEWPQVKVADMSKARYIRFTGKNGSVMIIDLDQYADSFGMIVADGKKPPRLLDMPNVNTELYNYFNR